jgi:hypothetical protein
MLGEFGIFVVFHATMWLEEGTEIYKEYTCFRCIRKIAKSDYSISLVISVCPSIRMEQLVCHWTDFCGIWYLSFFRKSVVKIQV